MSEHEWKPGDVALIRSPLGFDAVGLRSGVPSNMGWAYTSDELHGGPRHYGNCWLADPDGEAVIRPLVVIDPEDRGEVERLDDLIYSDRFDHEDTVDGTQAALREFANPQPRLWREAAVPVAPWPQVAECHSSHHADHECPQCAWEHEHDWVAWTTAPTGPGVPIRCTKCGGRKCDAPDCALLRHSHTHAESGESA